MVAWMVCYSYAIGVLVGWASSSGALSTGQGSIRVSQSHTDTRSTGLIATATCRLDPATRCRLDDSSPGDKPDSLSIYIIQHADILGYSHPRIPDADPGCAMHSRARRCTTEDPTRTCLFLIFFIVLNDQQLFNYKYVQSTL